MVKPDGVQRGLAGEVMQRIEKRGLKIVALRMNTISLDLAVKHYAEHAQKPFFNSFLFFAICSTSCPEQKF
jgi:nucleoside-diphosphate kinase